MSDLADIAAAAGIAILDDHDTLSDGGDMGHSSRSNTKPATLTSAVIPDGSGDTATLLEQEALDALFGHRFTEEDPDYAKTVAESEAQSHPPCVEGYFGRRQRDNSNRSRRDQNYGDRRDGRGHRGRGDYHHHQHHQGNWNQRHSHDWNRDRNGGYQNRDRYHRDRSPR